MPISQNLASYAFTGFALVLSVITASLYLAFPGGYLEITLQQPFTNWGALRRYFSDTLPITNFTTAIASDVSNIALCSTSSPACTCILDIVGTFLNETGTLRAAYYKQNNTSPTWYFPKDSSTKAGDRVLSCMRRRSTWDIWLTGIHLHPSAISFATISLVIVMGLAYIGMVALSLKSYVTIIIVGVYVGLSLALLGVLSFFSNMILMAQILVCVFGATFALRDELPPHTDNAIPSAPALMVAIHWATPHVSANVVAYLAATNTVRDLVGVLIFAALGYLSGLLTQRILWARTFLKQDYTASMQRSFGRSIGLALIVSWAVSWAGVVALSASEFYPPSSPIISTYASIPLVFLLLVYQALEVFTPVSQAEASFSVLDVAKLCTLSALLALFMAISSVDASRLN
jgi:hypothetical protein